MPRAVHDVLRSPGQPLDTATRMAMEPRFGHDFSRVRVHADERAAQSTMSVGALAYAAGQHIVLGSRSLPGEVMAHELAHVAQHRGGDVLPQRIAPASSPAEQEADRAAVSPHSVGESHDGSLHLYRPKKGSFNFGVADTPALVEEEFKDKTKQPWIETIDIVFNGTTVDTNGETIPTGTLTATYHANAAALSPIVVAVAGGTPKLGLTDITKNNKVDRIEGVGYNDKPLGKTLGEGPGTKYAKPDASGERQSSMHWAIFFKGGQAVHGGMLNVGSHACVHVAPSDMQQMNYHSAVGFTKVSTSYTSSALDPVCCERIKNKGFTKKGQAAHPCEKTEPSTCP